MLPVPVDDHLNLREVLVALASDRTPRVDVVVGPSDTGKSALLRSLAPAYRQLGDTVRLIDLSLHDWRRVFLSNDGIDVLFVDHIDRLPEPEHFRAAFEILDRAIPMLFASGLSRLVLTLSTDWRETFQTLYRLAPESLLVGAVSAAHSNVHLIRPYSDGELVELCTSAQLDPRLFAEPSLRRAGVLALAAAVDDESLALTGSCLRSVLACRWMEGGNSGRSGDVRRAIWELMGRRTLRDEIYSVRLSELQEALNHTYDMPTLRAQVGGPLHLKGGQVEWSSPAWADVAGANALRAVIQNPATEPIPRPVRRSVLQALLELTDRHDLTREVSEGIRNLQRSTRLPVHGYLGAALGTLSAHVTHGPELVFENLSLQGPDHSELQPVDAGVAAIVQDALQEAMSQAVDLLLTALNSTKPGIRSGFRGGYQCWQVAREWARALPLRAYAEGALKRVPGDGAWRYEDILDVAVTGATTTFMANHEDSIATPLDRHGSSLAEYLADVWDGVNDGAWDQIDASGWDYVGSLYLPPDMVTPLTAVRCSMQRAHLGSQDVRDWRFIECDLLLADFRSCRNIEQADFSGSNWWAAILPPPARYLLSRDCGTPAFLGWCQSPPWSNPYYTAQWPTPFAPLE